MRLRTIFLVLLLVSSSPSWSVRTAEKAFEPPKQLLPRGLSLGPQVICQQGETLWVQPYLDTSWCPGDPYGGHGGEATGGPDGSETWCFEAATYEEDFDPTINGEVVTSSDSCGRASPWSYLCWDHVDVTTMPSPSGINYWHIDTYCCDELGWPYAGAYCFWCGSDSLWIDGLPVACGMWCHTPGYGNLWHCVAQLELDQSFATTNGCTLYFDTRYDVECGMDILHVEVFNGSEWVEIATLTGRSGSPGKPCTPIYGSPDYFGNGDYADSARWQPRRPGSEDVPAFYRVIPPDTMLVGQAPRFRWRFKSDEFCSDADCGTNPLIPFTSKGAIFIDNVRVIGDPGNEYAEDFEHGSWSTLADRGWSLPAYEGVTDQWHQVHDGDPPYEGNDGHSPEGCSRDSSIAWTARPEQGFPQSAPWRDGWHYRLMSPSVPIPDGPQGNIVIAQFDIAVSASYFSCDRVDLKYRLHDGDCDRWCPWWNLDRAVWYSDYGGLYINCQDWGIARYAPGTDSVQFGWDAIDLCDRSRETRDHSEFECQVDNVSIGFSDYMATIFRLRPMDMLHDSYSRSEPGYNSLYPACCPPEGFSPGWWHKFVVDVIDYDGLADVRLYGSVDWGHTWQFKNLHLYQAATFDPSLGGTFAETFEPYDFGFGYPWPKGTEVWYYVRAEDHLANFEYFPAIADPAHPGHTNSHDDYFSFSILPTEPSILTNTRLLLVDGSGLGVHEWSPCLEDVSTILSGNDGGLEDVYEQVLIDAGYCYDKFDIGGAGTSEQIQCPQLRLYDGVIWFTGPYWERYLFDEFAQDSIDHYVSHGGKIVICGERIARYFADETQGGMGADSLGGRFLDGIMGCTYLGEMEDAFEKPYLYFEANDMLSLWGEDTLTVELDSLLAYRWCPGWPRDMSYVATISSPDTGYVVQYLLRQLNPPPAYDSADGAIYVEHPTSGGQCVFLNFDLSSLVNHSGSYCGGSPDGPVPPFTPGFYDGRLELMQLILGDIFGLTAPRDSGGGGKADLEPMTVYRWSLNQNVPNPLATSTDINYEVAAETRVSIDVYDVMGRHVCTLVDQRQVPGRYSIRWNGNNNAGQKVSSGVYFYRMETRDFSASRKLLILN